MKIYKDGLKLQILWQQFMQFVNLVLRDHFQHLSQPFKRVDIVFLACSEEGVKHGCPFSSSCGSGKQVVLPAQGNGANGIFCQVVP